MTLWCIIIYSLMNSQKFLEYTFMRIIRLKITLSLIFPPSSSQQPEGVWQRKVLGFTSIAAFYESL